MLNIYHLRTEYLKNPIGTDAKNPRLSWRIRSDRSKVMQKSYRILAAEDEAFCHILWDSQTIRSAECRFIPYEGPELSSGQRVYWKVFVDTGDETSESETAFFEMGLLNKEDWHAKWLELSHDEDIETYHPAKYLRKVFTVKPGLKRARIFQTAHGLYEFWMNGQRGTQDVFKPGFTSYYERIQYQEYDIQDLLSEGENAWSVIVADGWWHGTAGGMYRNNFGYTLQFFGQLLLEYEDGTASVIGTDESWKTAECGLRMSDMKFGEVFDASLEPIGWKKVDFDDTAWSFAVLANGDHLNTDLLIPSRSVPCREKEHFFPQIFTDKEGSTILDFGQNLAGYVKMTLRNTKPGQMITLIHGEDIKDGIFNLGNVCTPISDNTHYQQVDYLARGSEKETYQPIFEIFGFRYVKITGTEGELKPEDFEAIAVYSDLEQTGDFTCSNELINQLVKNSRWSQKGNFLDVPTDCPTRERSPWIGDAHVYAKTASRFMDVYSFFEKWMQDVTLEQYPDGRIANSVPATTSMHFAEEVERLIRENKCYFVVPGIIGKDGRPGVYDGSAGWGDVATILPMNMYLCYGDIRILENQYETAKRWTDYMIAAAKEPNENRLKEPEYQNITDGVRDADYIFDTRFHFGEWLEPDSEEAGHPTEQDLEGQKKRTDALVATAYMYHSSVLVAKMAELLGKGNDRKYYLDYSEKVKSVYNKYFIKSDGSILEGRQAPNVRSLQFGLCSEENKPKVAEKLVEYIRNNGMRLNTGFLSTPFLLFQLVENGYEKEAYAVLEQTKSPSWLHAVELGATTILEDWTGMETHMNSFNHYSYGAVCDFLFGVTCGIQPVLESPGYQHFTVCPLPGGTLTFAKASFESPFGKIRSEWEKTSNGYRYHIEIPANTTASIILPDGQTYEAGSGIYEYITVEKESAAVH